MDINMEAQRTKEEFPGTLKYLRPNQVLDPGEKDDVAEFFLVLGLIFNDLKGITLFHRLLSETYRIPPDGEVSDHSGNYNGVLTQIHRLFAGIIHEFFIFVEKNQSVLKASEVTGIVGSLRSDHRDTWEELVNAACGRIEEASPFTSIIVQIRNNVAFHYHQSSATLRNGYIKHFFQSPQTSVNQRAYYSLGTNMNETRFYFADAAAEQYLQSLIQNSIDQEVYQKQLFGVMQRMNDVLASLLKSFIKRRQYSKL